MNIKDNYYKFDVLPELNEIPIEDNTKEILNLRYFMEFKKNNYKENSFEQLCRRVSKVVASAEYDFVIDELDIDENEKFNRLTNIEDSIYNDMMSHRFLFNSPALFSAGNGQNANDIYVKEFRKLETYENVSKNTTQNQMMFACFTLPVDDSLEGIFDSAKNAAIISKFGGGVGANFGNLREKDSLIKDGIAGKSSGPISFMQVWNTMGSVVVQGGRRRAALMGMLYSNHPDIEEFVTCKTEDGNLNYFNISVAIDNTFMDAVKKDLDYCLISPKDKKVIKTIKAKALWNNICESAHKRGDPGIFFIDIANEDSLIKDESNKYKIESTNPCCSSDTLVATNKGYKYAKDININDKLVTTLGIEDIKNIEVNENIDLYEIELSDGGTIKVTPSHQFQAIKFGKGKSATKKYEFIKVEDLKVGDYIRVAPTILPNNKINTFGFDDFDFGTLVGILLGDGCITEKMIDRDRVKICCGKSEMEWVIEIEKLLNKYNISYFEAKEKNTITICINNNDNLLNMIKYYNISGYSYDKQLPLELINSNRDILAGILNGYISTDGNINLKSTHPLIRIDSCNKKLLENVRYILLGFGVHNSFRVGQRSNSIIEGRLVNSRNKNTITISGNSFKQLAINIKLTNPYKAKKIEEALINYSLTGNTWKSTIKSIKYIGKETVYDFYCEKSDTWITNGYVSRGCGEQPLPNATSCNLGSINVSEFVKNNKFDTEGFREQVIRAIYYLDLVIDATEYPLPDIEKRTRAIRPVGLGIMGLADLAIKIGTRYGSKGFIELCETIGKIMASASLFSTIEIAKLKGSYEEFDNITLPMLYSFIDYNKLKKDVKLVEPDTPFNIFNLQQLISFNSDLSDDILNNIYNQLIDNEKIPFTFANAMKALYQDKSGNCNWLYDMFTYGLRNSRRLSIAPTGTISLILNTSSSIEPNFAYEWIRTVTVDSTTKQDMKFYHKLMNEKNKNAGILVSASELNINEHIECIAEFAKWVDSGISKTVNLPNNATVDDVKKIYDYCYDHKIKGITIYRDGSRNNQPLKKEVKETNNITIDNDTAITEPIDSDNYNSIRVRPKIMKGLTTKSDSPYGSIYVTANFDDNNKIFETFISAGKSGSVSKSVTEALSRVISLALRANVDINDIIKTISNISGSEIWVYDTINGKEVYVKSIPDATAKMLSDLNEYSTTLSNNFNNSLHKKVIKDSIKESDDIELIHNNICPECGKSMITVSGCLCCMSCGYSPCK